MTTPKALTDQPRVGLVRPVPGTLPEQSSTVRPSAWVTLVACRPREGLDFPSPGFSGTDQQRRATCDPLVTTAEQAIAWGYPRPARRGFAAPRGHTLSVATAPLPGRCTRPNSRTEKESQTADIPDSGAEQ